MTLSQDHRSPHDQQRWIELENVGSAPIQPFAALEIVDSYRPESGGYTPGDGRTVLRVRRSTKDNPCGTVINGPCEILPGRSGRIGTMDDPMLALVYEEYDPGTVVGVRKDSFLLEDGYCGYLILGDYDAGTGTMRVKRWENCQQELMVKAVECIKPGEYDKACQPQKWNATTRCWVDDPNAHQVYICDCNKWLLALPGECFKVERMNSCGSETGTCYRPSFPYGLTRRVKIKEEIAYNSCGPVTILKGNDGCLLTESECEIQACNTTRRKLACDADEYATFHAQPGECGGEAPTCYGWLVANPRALRAKAALSDRLCGGAAGIYDIEYLDVSEWSVRGDPPDTAGNPLSLQACENDVVELEWNDATCGWDVVGVPDHALPDFMLNIRCATGGCKIEKQSLRSVTPVYGHQCYCPPSTEWDDTSVTGVRRTFVTGVALSTTGGTCSIAATKKSYCILCDDEENETPDAISFVEVHAANDVQFTCDPCPQLDWTKLGFFALCVGSEETGGSGTCTCEPCEGASATPSSTPSSTGG